jgi:PmbA protein
MQAPVQSRVDGTRIPELKNIVSDALAHARSLGATQAEADVSLQKGLTTTVRLGEVETVEYQRDRGMGVTVYFGKRKGSASTADLSARAVAETVEKACDIARYTAEDDCAGLADPEELARDIPDLDLDHPWDISPEQAVRPGARLRSRRRVVDTRITNSEGATVGSHRGVRVYGNSHGFLAGYPSTSHSVSCVLLAQTGDDMQRDYWYSSARDATRSRERPRSSAARPADARSRGSARARSRRKGARVCTRPKWRAASSATFSARCAAAASIARARSCSAPRAAGVPDLPRTARAPAHPKALGSSRSTAKASHARSRAGAGRHAAGIRARQLLGAQARAQDHRQCRRHAQPAGGIEAGGCADRALMRELGTGLLVTELMGRASTASPATTRAALGFWVENGVSVYPVHEITIAGNLNGHVPQDRRHR